jgi:hypothetical protein
MSLSGNAFEQGMPNRLSEGLAGHFMVAAAILRDRAHFFDEIPRQ